jgi:hypothetical protein
MPFVARKVYTPISSTSSGPRLRCGKALSCARWAAQRAKIRTLPEAKRRVAKTEKTDQIQPRRNEIATASTWLWTSSLRRAFWM